MIEMTPFPLRWDRPAWSTAVGLGPISLSVRRFGIRSPHHDFYSLRNLCIFRKLRLQVATLHPIRALCHSRVLSSTTVALAFEDSASLLQVPQTLTGTLWQSNPWS